MHAWAQRSHTRRPYVILHRIHCPTRNVFLVLFNTPSMRAVRVRAVRPIHPRRACIFQGWAAAAGEKGPHHVLAHSIQGPQERLIFSVWGASTPSNSPGKGELARFGDRMQPHAARMQPRKCPIFLARGPALRPASCRSPNMQALHPRAWMGCGTWTPPLPRAWY